MEPQTDLFKPLGLSLAAVFLIAAPLAAQDVNVEVATEQSPYYVGEPVVIQFTVEGFDEQPQPTCQMQNASIDLRGQLSGASPSVFSQIVQQNGRLYQNKRITYRIEYQVTSATAGERKVGPFLLQQGNKSTTVDAITMNFKEVAEDPDMRVRLILPDGPVYPDQRVPVKVEWWYAGDFENIVKLGIYSPLFDKFTFAPDPQPSRRTTLLPIDTAEGRLRMPAEVREEQHDGRRFRVLTAARTLIPDRPGEHELSPITATLQKATAWSRGRSGGDDPFGSFFSDMFEPRRRPTRVEVVAASGRPQTLLVRPFPKANQPQSFAGAVGKGFSLQVEADRTVVRVGDPIKLDVTLRGDGNIANASLPDLSADGGMKPDSFRLPDAAPPGEMIDGAKRFSVSVRVEDESVSEIPALAYSWFDPERQEYQTARSKPIALRVMPAEVVSASDVVSAARPTRMAPKDIDESSESTSAPRGSSSSLTGAYLAIETDPGVALRDMRADRMTLALQTAAYGFGLLLVALAVFDRKRREVDPGVLAARKVLKEQRSRIDKAAGLPRKQGAEEIASALRQLLAEFPDGTRERAQAVIARCESVVYSPSNDGAGSIESELIDEAKAAAAGFSEEARA